MRTDYLRDVDTSYDIVSVDPKDGIVDIVDGEFTSIKSCEQIIEVHKRESPYFFEDGCYLAIRQITRKLI